MDWICIKGEINRKKARQVKCKCSFFFIYGWRQRNYTWITHLLQHLVCYYLYVHFIIITLKYTFIQFILLFPPLFFYPLLLVIALSICFTWSQVQSDGFLVSWMEEWEKKRRFSLPSIHFVQLEIPAKSETSVNASQWTFYQLRLFSGTNALLTLQW
jgi:hypothetical protein